MFFSIANKNKNISNKYWYLPSISSLRTIAIFLYPSFHCQYHSWNLRRIYIYIYIYSMYILLYKGDTSKTKKLYSYFNFLGTALFVPIWTHGNLPVHQYLGKGWNWEYLLYTSGQEIIKQTILNWINIEMNSQCSKNHKMKHITYNKAKVSFEACS